MPPLKKLKIILQSKYAYIILEIFVSLYVLLFTIIIKYETKLANVTIIEGIIQELVVSDDAISFVLKTDELVKCNYYLKSNDTYDYYSLLGKKVKLEGMVKLPSNNTIFNAFNYKQYLYNNGIYITFIVSKIEVIDDESIFYKIKTSIIKRINTYDNQIKSYLNLFILGDKNYLQDEVYDNYRINGIWHLFAISGMHINLIIVVVSFVLKKMRLKNIFISLFLFFFMFLTNFSASIMRATIFFYLKKLFEYFKINISNMQVLFLTASIILLIDPFMIYNAGFQYSFIITFAIMFMSDKITGNYFMKIFKISLISFVVSLPITVNMNYELNILSIFLNIIYVPFISFVVFPLSIIVFIVPVFAGVLAFLINILEYTNELFNMLKINIIINKLPIYIIILYYLFVWVFGLTNKRRYLILAFLFIVINRIMVTFDSHYYVYFNDVRQGDCALIITPYKKEVIMIDTGGLLNSSFNVIDNVLVFLKSNGLRKIDYLILSHGDYDHMGDAINLVNKFRVEKVIFNCGSYNDLEQDLIQVLDKKKISYNSCINELNIADNKLYFLKTRDYGNENDNSSVIYAKINDYKFLFMGDAGVEVEEDLIEKYNLQNIDVLKVGHHGSKTSSSKNFIDEIEPKYSIISVGKNNRYGHPNKEVLENLDNLKIYRTDQDGSIMFKIKNNKLEIETCTP